MEITEFLDARIAEDEAVARAASTYWHGVSVESSTSAEETHVRRHDPDRVLAECAAKRQMIEQASEATSDRYSVIGEFCVGREETQEAMDTDPGEMILRALATVYASHPDFDPAWEIDSTSP